MTNNLITARSQLTALNAETTELQTRRADLLAELETVNRQLHDAAAKVAPLVARVRELEREPRDRQQLATLAETLAAKLAKAPERSPTVRSLKSQVEHLADETVSAADRLSSARRMLEDLARYPVLDGHVFASNTPRVAGREGR